MTIPEIVAIAALILSIAGLVYNAGKLSERQEQSERQTKAWADGLGNLERKNSTQSERRHWLQLADDVEVADTQTKRNRLATRIREEAWRK
jgi:hypothetical protein